MSMWAMQADQQVALLPHFSREERCIKVAFERVSAAAIFLSVDVIHEDITLYSGAVH